jgi:hypothetical protein
MGESWMEKRHVVFEQRKTPKTQAGEDLMSGQKRGVDVLGAIRVVFIAWIKD